MALEILQSPFLKSQFVAAVAVVVADRGQVEVDDEDRAGREM